MLTMFDRICRRGLLVGALMTIPALAHAQASVEVNAGIQFDFLNPGARSLGVGGAFTGQPDDATSGFANPAGLLSLSRPEASIEVRNRGFSTPFTDRGHAFGAPTGEGVDTQAGLFDGTSDESNFGASFLSAVYPRRRWAIAGYRHELARFRTTLATQGAFYDTSPTTVARAFPADGDLKLDIIAYGASAAARLHEKVSVGISLAFYDFDLTSTTRRYGVPDFFGAANRTSANLLNMQTQDGSDTAVGVNLGVAWEVNPAFQVGAVYRQGPGFKVRVQNTLATTGEVRLDAQGEFNVPDVYSVGFALRPVQNVRVSLDFNRVLYSSLTDGFVSVFAGQADDFHVDDALEVHGGVEYGLLNLKYPVFLRGGLWFDPAHSIVYDPLSSRPVAESLLFRQRDDEFHYAFGAGVSLGPRFEANVGVDLSDRSNTFSASTVVRF
jgi:long-chain fatty acid transport protein